MDKLTLSDKAKNLKLGIYQHFKHGPEKQYQVFGVGLHSETLDEYAVYQALYGEKTIWLRPLEMFLEEMEIDGVKKPRFSYIQPVRE